jgi:hypothetical protein
MLSVPGLPLPGFANDLQRQGELMTFAGFLRTVLAYGAIPAYATYKGMELLIYIGW